MYAELLKGGREDGKPGGLSPKSVGYLHNTMHKALRDAERKQLTTRNVASAADPPRVRQSGSPDMKTWTVEELRIFLSAMSDHRLGTAYLLAATTGMRRGEVLGVRWSDLDVAARRLAIRQTVISVNDRFEIGTPKTARGRRSVALDPRTVTALEAHRDRQATERSLLGEGYRNQDLTGLRPSPTSRCGGDGLVGGWYGLGQIPDWPGVEAVAVLAGRS